MRVTYDVVSFGGLGQKEGGLAVLGDVALKHVEGLAESKIAHDVESKVRAQG